MGRQFEQITRFLEFLEVQDYLQTNIQTMASDSVLEIFDRVSEKVPLNGRKSSWVGFIGTLALLALCLWFYVPAVMSYFSGNYYQSMYETDTNFAHTFFSRDDYKLAIVFKNKQDGSVYNHSSLLSNLQTLVYSSNYTSTAFQPLSVCDKNYFAEDINGIVLEDCLMVPDFVEYDAGFSQGTFSYLTFSIKVPTVSSPFPTSVFTLSFQQQMFTNILTNYYCEFYFTSKVLTPNGSLKFQLHRAYSTEINVGSDTIGGNFNIFAGLRVTLMDNSIMPWRNSRNVTAMSWSGEYQGTSAQSIQDAATNGVQQVFKVRDNMQIAVRYYKKLDWLLGTIGGGIFLLFIIFWVFFNYYNCTLQKFELANKLILQATSQDNPVSDEDLIPVKIPTYYMIKRFIPFCKNENFEKCIQESQNENDIILLVKRQKVTFRNLQKKNLLPEFQPRILDFPELDQLNKEQDSSLQSSQRQNEVYINQNERSNQVMNTSNIPMVSHAILREQDSNVNDESVSQSDAERPQGVKRNSEVKIPLEDESEDVRGSQEPLSIVKKQFNQASFRIPVLNINQEENGVQIPEVYEHLKHQKNQKNQRNSAEKEESVNSQEKENEKIEAPKIYQPIQHEQDPIAINDQIAPPPPQQMILNLYNNQQILLNIPPNQQVIIIGNQQQLEQHNFIQQIQVQPHPIVEPPRNLFPSPIDPKFNLTHEQLDYLKHNVEAGKILENNHTYLAIAANKPDHFENEMNLNKYDKWSGHFTLNIQSCGKQCKELVAKVFKKFDFFNVRVTLIDNSHSSTCCGVFLTAIILILSVLTFALTISNMNQKQFIISQNYIPLNKVSFSKQTDDFFNAVMCISNPVYVTGVSKYAMLNFFTVNNGVTKFYNPVQLLANDPVLNLPNSLHYFPAPVILTNCFKFPNGITATINNNNSYFGMSLTPYCSGLSSFCLANQVITNNNFMNAINNIKVLVILPGARLDPTTQNLVSDVMSTPEINFDLMKMNANMALEETAYTNLVRLYDDTGNNFMHEAPLLQNQNINVGYNNRKTYVKASTTSSPAYSFLVKLNQASTDYTVTQKKIDWIFGIIGGAFVFWYAIIHLLGKLYMHFNFNMYIAKTIYEEDAYDDYLFKKFLAILPLPRCLIPSCLDIRSDVCRMKQIDKSINNTLSHETLIKYTDSCYRLSTSFFSRLEEKNFALIYFREKIFENEMIFARKQQQKSKEEILLEYIEQQDNQLENINEKKMEKEGQKSNLKNDQYERDLGTNHVIDPKITKFTDYVDMFDQPPTFTFRGERAFSSVSGGICCLLMLLFIIIVANYEVTLYLTGAGMTSSYDIIMDDGIGSQGLTLTTGKDFKIGVNFMSSSTILAIDPTPYLQTVGISLLLQQFKRQNGIIVPNITSIDLVPCPQGYIESWVTPNVDISYYAGLNLAYCAPDGVSLQISGTPQELVRNNFKLSIYNKAGNAYGVGNLTTLLNTTFVKLYFSSPRQNSLSRTVDYEIQSILFTNFGGIKTLYPYETNMTFSKSNVTYDDTPYYQKESQNQLTYRFEPYAEQWLGYEYYGNKTNLWFNISFSYSHKIYNYNISTPKFYEVFGTIGGIIAFLYFLVSCFARSFNQYKLRYEIGIDLYLFDKQRIIYQKDKISKRLKKSASDSKRIKEFNRFSEISLLKAYFLSPFGWMTNNYNFSQTLRIVTLIQNRVALNLDISQSYLNLYRARDAIEKNLEVKKSSTINLIDIYLKKIVNFQPWKQNVPFLQNYTKKNNLSSYDQMSALKAKVANINIKDVFDDKYIATQFNVAMDLSVLSLNMMRDTEGSINSSALSGINSSIGQESVVGREN